MEFRIELWLHVIFSAIDHKPLIKKPNLMHRLLTEAFERRACKVVEVGGTPNHVHLLLAMNAEESVDSVIKRVKLSSETEYRRAQSDFLWSPGYYAFTTSTESLDLERFSIMQQEVFHRRVSHEEELEHYRRDMELEAADELTDLDEHQMN